MTESYELPVLFTDDECKAYAAWGMKKEKSVHSFFLSKNRKKKKGIVL